MLKGFQGDSQLSSADAEIHNFVGRLFAVDFSVSMEGKSRGPDKINTGCALVFFHISYKKRENIQILGNISE